MYTCTHVHMYACTHVHMYTCTHVHMYTCTHVRMYTCRHVYMYTCIHVHMYACTHVHMYTNRRRIAEVSNLDIRDSESLRAWLWAHCGVWQPHTACTQDSSSEAAVAVRTAAILNYHSCSFHQFFQAHVQVVPQNTTRPFRPNPLQFVIHFPS